jgi:putative heme iron utilization protein
MNDVAQPEPKESAHRLLTEIRSLFLATLNPAQEPFASFAPFYADLENNQLLVFLSDLSEHTSHLRQVPKASVMIAADEAESQQIYIRLRLQYQVNAEEITEPELREKGLGLLESKHGNIIEMLKQLPDFRLFALKPTKGSYVQGFGQAFRIRGEALLGEFEAITKDNLKE